MKEGDLPRSSESSGAQARREAWESRYNRFKFEWKHRTVRGADASGQPYMVESEGHRYDWMTPENLGAYLHFRLDQIDRAGGTDAEKQFRKDAVAAGQPRAESLDVDTLLLRLSSLGSEVICWGGQAWEDFDRVKRALSGHSPEAVRRAIRTHKPDEVRRPPTLSSHQEVLLESLTRRIAR
jgi:hypothetical protein